MTSKPRIQAATHSQPCATFYVAQAAYCAGRAAARGRAAVLSAAQAAFSRRRWLGYAPQAVDAAQVHVQHVQRSCAAHAHCWRRRRVAQAPVPGRAEAERQRGAVRRRAAASTAPRGAGLCPSTPAAGYSCVPCSTEQDGDSTTTARSRAVAVPTAHNTGANFTHSTRVASAPGPQAHSEALSQGAPIELGLLDALRLAGSCLGAALHRRAHAALYPFSHAVSAEVCRCTPFKVTSTAVAETPGVETHTFG